MIFQNIQSDQIFVHISPTYSCPVTYVATQLLVYCNNAGKFVLTSREKKRAIADKKCQMS